MKARNSKHDIRKGVFTSNKDRALVSNFDIRISDFFKALNSKFEIRKGVFTSNKDCALVSNFDIGVSDLLE